MVRFLYPLLNPIKLYRACRVSPENSQFRCSQNTNFQMTDQILIRPRHDSDIPALSNILRSVHTSSGYPVEGVSNPSSFINPPDLLKAWVTLHKDRIVGHVAILPTSPNNLTARIYAETGGDVTKITSLGRLFVDPEVRGKGFGKSLVGAAEQWAKAEGLRLLLTVLEKDEVAKRMYEKLGWEILEKHVYNDGEREHDAFVYASPVSTETT